MLTDNFHKYSFIQGFNFCQLYRLYPRTAPPSLSYFSCSQSTSVLTVLLDITANRSIQPRENSERQALRFKMANSEARLHNKSPVLIPLVQRQDFYT